MATKPVLCPSRAQPRRSRGACGDDVPIRDRPLRVLASDNRALDPHLANYGSFETRLRRGAAVPGGGSVTGVEQSGAAALTCSQVGLVGGEPQGALFFVVGGQSAR